MLGGRDEAGSAGRGESPGNGAVGHGQKRAHAAAPLSAFAAVHHLAPGACPPLWSEYVPGNALPGGYSAENLQHHRRQLGAGRKCALQRHLQGRRGTGRGGGSGAGQGCGRGMGQGHGGQQKRYRPGFRGSGGRGDQGHRRGSTDSGFPGARAADSGAAGGENWPAALPAGAQLEYHGTDEHPAGRPADLGIVGPAPGGGAGHGKNLPDVPGSGGTGRPGENRMG